MLCIQGLYAKFMDIFAILLFAKQFDSTIEECLCTVRFVNEVFITPPTNLF